jgi:hypothetical protein
MTEHCDVVHPCERWQEHFLRRVDTALGQALDRDQRNGTTNLSAALKKAKEISDV